MFRCVCGKLSNVPKINYNLRHYRILLPTCSDIISRPFQPNVNNLLQVKNVSISTAENINKPNLLQKLRNLLNFKEKFVLKARSYDLYEGITESVDYLTYFKYLKMDDTFNSWFIVTELHVWMLMVKLMSEGENGRICRNALVEALWDDSSKRGKRLCPESTAIVNSQIWTLYDQFQASIIGYDEGLLGDDTVLASAIWRRFFLRESEDMEKIEILVSFIRSTIRYLETIPMQDIVNGVQIEWPKLNEHIKLVQSSL